MKLLLASASLRKLALFVSLAFLSLAGVAESSATTAAPGPDPSPHTPPSRDPNWPAKSLSAADFAALLDDDWEADHAVLLHASWCRYCKQFRPIWRAVAEWLAGAAHLELAAFDCEADAAHQALCARVGVKHYPSVLFVGHGAYHAASAVGGGGGGLLRRLGGWLLGRAAAPAVPPPRAVLYPGELYFESVRDWCRAMRLLSRASRWSASWAAGLRRLVPWGDGGGGSGAWLSPAEAKLARARAEVKALRSAAAMAVADEAERTAAARDQAALAATYGSRLDPFEVLNAVGYGVAAVATYDSTAEAAPKAGATSTTESARAAAATAAVVLGGVVERLPALNATAAARLLRACVAECSEQHCKGRGPERAEPWCALVGPCWEGGFGGRGACRPATCPLHAPGCAFASVCLNPEVLAQFHQGGSGNGQGQGKTGGRSQAAASLSGGGGESGDTAGSEGSDAEGSLEMDAEVNGGFGDGRGDEVDPAVAAAAAAASARATGVGRGAPAAAVDGTAAPGRLGRAPRRRSLWDSNAASAAPQASPQAGDAVGAGSAPATRAAEAAAARAGGQAGEEADVAKPKQKVIV